MGAAISVKGLRKSYGSLEAVRGIDITVDKGEVFALLGPNGAGKTTTVEILEGFRGRDGGEVSVLGHDPARASAQMRSEIGMVLQSSGAIPYLTVAETLRMFAGYYPSPMDVDAVLELAGLTEKARSRVKKLSGGQQRRLDVAISLVGDPRVLFLDEPTTGFDPSARRSAWEMLKELAALGKTVMMTTHYMDEAQHLADRVAIISSGEIVAEGPPSTLAGDGPTRSRISFQLDETSPPLPAGLLATIVREGAGVEFLTEDPASTLHVLTGWAIENRIDLTTLRVSRPSLEDVYLELTEEAETQ
jgi:ABC-2 type transport system ATP-binding protein